MLWDLSYILENSYRIALGDLPYRDFPFPYPPLTFLTQALLIRFTGRVFWHHIAYCAIAGGLATILTWRILVHSLRDAVPWPRALAFGLSLPLIVLGIYCVYPHPFYDPDCTMAILLGVFMLQRVDRHSSSAFTSLLAGATLAVPLFVKQNAGLPFIGSSGLAVLVLAIVALWRQRSVKKHALILVGVVAAVALAATLIHFTVGLKNYWYWTITFAAARRTPARGDMMAIYTDKTVVISSLIVIAGLIAFWVSRRGSRVLSASGLLLMAIPFCWPTIYLLRESDSSERAERLLTLWPVTICLCLIVAILSIRRRMGASLVLPFILIATINGVFMSQQLWGSTYAIWPLFMILISSSLAGLNSLSSKSTPSRQSSQSNSVRLLFLLTGLIVLSLLIAGGFYVKSHERLDYANLDDGALTHSSLPALKGLATRGDWLPNFEELVEYAEREIPRDQGILILPGEDLFYYATGRRPQFPVLMFDHTINPYSPEEILQLARDRQINWVIVKQDLQDEDEEPEKMRDQITEALEREFEQVESLNNYDIYRRGQPDNPSDSDDDDGKP